MVGTRRRFLAAGLAGAGSTLLGRGMALAAGQDPDRPTAELPPPRFTLSMNLELMFPADMPYPDRIAAVAACGARHYGFWGHPGKDLDAMLAAQEAHGLTCVSITGAPKTGWSTGLTRPGSEAAYLDDIEGACRVARRFGAENLITFVGRRQDDIPWDRQREQIVAGLKRAGEVARDYNVFITLEPLNRVESPQMTMLTAREAYELAAAADHPHVKVDFDLYHRQLGEGNVTPMLEEGLAAGLVRFVEVGALPGRKEPGTGELDEAFVFAALRRHGFSGYVGMECGTTKDPQHAWDATRRLAGLA